VFSWRAFKVPRAPEFAHCLALLHCVALGNTVWFIINLRDRRMAPEHTFIVTGAASGIGHATALRLIERGHRVLSLDVKNPTAQVSSHMSCDLSDPTSIDSALSRIEERVSALLNIAGVPGTVGAEKTMRVNLLGLRQLTEGLWDRIVDNGRIVNVASIAGS